MGLAAAPAAVVPSCCTNAIADCSRSTPSAGVAIEARQRMGPSQSKGAALGDADPSGPRGFASRAAQRPCKNPPTPYAKPAKIPRT